MCVCLCVCVCVRMCVCVYTCVVSLWNLCFLYTVLGSVCVVTVKLSSQCVCVSLLLLWSCPVSPPPPLPSTPLAPSSPLRLSTAHYKHQGSVFFMTSRMQHSWRMSATPLETTGERIKELNLAVDFIEKCCVSEGNPLQTQAKLSAAQC